DVRGVGRVEQLAERLAIADPRRDAWIGADIVEDSAEVEAGNQQLTRQRQLHALAENLPRRIVVLHHLVAGIDVQIPDVRAFWLFRAEVLVDGLAERANDLAARPAESDQKVIGIGHGSSCNRSLSSAA